MALQPRPKKETLRSWCDYAEFHKVEDIVGSIKKYTARRLNKIHGRTRKPLWQEEAFDRIVRSDRDLDGLVNCSRVNRRLWRRDSKRLCRSGIPGERRHLA